MGNEVHPRSTCLSMFMCGVLEQGGWTLAVCIYGCMVGFAAIMDMARVIRI